MEIKPILSTLMRNKTGVFVIAAQVALTLAIVANVFYIVRDRLNEANRPSGVDEGSGGGEPQASRARTIEVESKGSSEGGQAWPRKRTLPCV